MAYDETLAERIRSYFATVDGVEERKMFGGLAFLLRGNMSCGVVGSDLMLRLGNEGAAAALAEPHVRPMDFTGRPMKSMVYVLAEGIRRQEDLECWLEKAEAFAASLPPK
jgi:TfoX/Sxy family transcriptional regulator of competence genes